MDLLKIALGIVTSIAGFLDAGSIATAAQAGASFRYTLIWAILLGTLTAIFATEMTGRLAAVSRHTLADAIRERLGASGSLCPGARTVTASGGTRSTWKTSAGRVCCAIRPSWKR